ncbi:Putative_papain-like cysteine peptidase (DUF1796) [Hexamita inflata]|uniref:Papain-like cysteine peptidase (DUF1796) n=1 Tax=Hexamita inflata TaxID=28002 RepID=A0AA86TBC4_9EUKA|nr:Putative papain-like cysteine peptidase (DUF1796) [Hexamita inflata]
MITILTYQRFLWFKGDSAIQFNRSNKTEIFDAVISLGAWCQVGNMIHNYNLTLIESPFSNFGFKTWQNIIDLLENNFTDYWNRSNMYVTKAATEKSLKQKDNRHVLHVYDAKYNVLSNHNFDVCNNPGSKINTYMFYEFKAHQSRLIEIFNAQMDQLEKVCFVLKVMSVPETTLTHENIQRLHSVLSAKRNGKQFQLRMSVPRQMLDQTEKMVKKLKLKNVKLIFYTEHWNYDFTTYEWAQMLGDIRLSANHKEQLENIVNRPQYNFEDVAFHQEQIQQLQTSQMFIYLKIIKQNCDLRTLFLIQHLLQSFCYLNQQRNQLHFTNSQFTNFSHLKFYNQVDYSFRLFNIKKVVQNIHIQYIIYLKQSYIVYKTIMKIFFIISGRQVRLRMQKVTM